MPDLWGRKCRHCDPTNLLLAGLKNDQQFQRVNRQRLCHHTAGDQYRQRRLVILIGEVPGVWHNVGMAAATQAAGVGTMRQLEHFGLAAHCQRLVQE